jgi:TonB family protein
MSVQTVTDVIRARAHGEDRSGLGWSVGLHVLLVVALVAMPARWRQHVDDGPRTVMTISLGGTPGPRNGGETPMGGRAVAPAPTPPTPHVADAPPPPKAPEMALPDRRRPPRQVARSTAPSATPRTAATAAPAAAAPQAGSTPVNTGVRGQGFGLTTTGGGGGSGVQLDVQNFCCPEYLTQMIALIQRNWQSSQGTAGSVVMKFTIARPGTIDRVQVEQSSGLLAHELAAQRALLLTKLPELPAQFPNAELTVHMRFEYQR